VIIDLDRFVASEQRFWNELEERLDALQSPASQLAMDDARRLHYLYQRAASDLSRLADFPAEPSLKEYLQRLVARAYGEIHTHQTRRVRLRPLHWFFYTFPQAFRRHSGAFMAALLITLGGAAFGAVVLHVDYEAKMYIFPPQFGHLYGDPSERVAHEESVEEDRMEGRRAAFSAQLMTHNTRVSILAMALGMTFGVGSILLLLFNGVIIGAVVYDYIQAGEGVFLSGWLLPHGSVEIPAILIGGQCGLVIASALIGWGTRTPLRSRLRAVRDDVVTLIFGLALLLVWAGIVEAFFSQYHEPIIPYWAKITFGTVQLAALAVFLAVSGRGRREPPA
jgi:uncharacterized membrane protein SpoIIM required for sporulation